MSGFSAAPSVLKALARQLEMRLSAADVHVYVASAAALVIPPAHAVHVFALSHDPVPQAAVQVVMTPVAPTVFLVVEDAAHPPVANRVSVADVQVYVTALRVTSAPVIPVQAVQTPESCNTHTHTHTHTVSESV